MKKEKGGKKKGQDSQNVQNRWCKTTIQMEIR